MSKSILVLFRDRRDEQSSKSGQRRFHLKCEAAALVVSECFVEAVR